MEIAYKFHKVNGIKLHVLHAGLQHDKVIVMLHGFPEYHHGWKNQIDFFAEKGYHVVVPDQRGYGDSDKPSGIKSYVLSELAEDIVQLINSITDSKVVVIGHDWGGGVAWTLAQYHSELIERLVIMNMPHMQVMKQTLLTSAEQRKKSWYAVFFQLPLLPEFLLSFANYILLELSLSKASHKNTFSPTELAGYKKAWRKTNHLTSMLNWYRAFFLNKLDVDKDIDIPTLIIWGAKDRALSVEMAYESIKRCIDGKLIVLEDLTHWLHHEDPEKINGLVRSFLEDKRR